MTKLTIIMQTDGRQQILDDLKETVHDFITDLGVIFTEPTEKGDLSMVEFFYKRLHAETVMQHAITQLLPHKKRIQKRDIEFFDQNRYIFAGLPDDRVSYYGDVIIRSSRFTEDDITAVWDYLDAMVELAENYKKTQ